MGEVHKVDQGEVQDNQTRGGGGWECTKTVANPSVLAGQFPDNINYG